MRYVVAAALVLGSLGHASPAQADDGPGFVIGARPAWFVIGGVVTGSTVAVADRGAFVGGELLLARVRGAGFLGVHADGIYDFGTDRSYATAGLEAGFIRRGLVPIGVGADVGPALRVGGPSALGATARLFVSVAGTLTLYSRYYHFGTGDNEQILQVGVALKFPLAPPFGAGARR